MWHLRACIIQQFFTHITQTTLKMTPLSAKAEMFGAQNHPLPLSLYSRVCCVCVCVGVEHGGPFTGASKFSSWPSSPLQIYNCALCPFSSQEFWRSLSCFCRMGLVGVVGGVNGNSVSAADFQIQLLCVLSLLEMVRFI